QQNTHSDDSMVQQTHTQMTAQCSKTHTHTTQHGASRHTLMQITDTM
ncbi:unnamed protein product, partial [marine sediment metagenome]